MSLVMSSRLLDLQARCNTSCSLLQYVFVLLRGQESYVGGHLWRSDNYGNGNWVDVTNKLKGQRCVLMYQCQLHPFIKKADVGFCLW